MIDPKIERINQLSRKSKTEGLTPAEAAEQKALRQEYIAGFRSSLKAQLDATTVVNPDGTTYSLKDKAEKSAKAGMLQGRELLQKEGN